jgi:hypothetical protein
MRNYAITLVSVILTSVRVRVRFSQTVSQSVCLGVEPTLWTFDQILLPFQEFGSGICCPVCGVPSLTVGRVCLCKSQPSNLSECIFTINIFVFHISVTHTNTHTYIYTYRCPRRDVPDFGRVFLMVKYTDITQNTYVQSWTITEIMARDVAHSKYTTSIIRSLRSAGEMPTCTCRWLHDDFP